MPRRGAYLVDGITPGCLALVFLSREHPSYSFYGLDIVVKNEQPRRGGSIRGSRNSPPCLHHII